MCAWECMRAVYVRLAGGGGRTKKEVHKAGGTHCKHTL